MGDLADLQRTADAWARRNCRALPANWAFDHAAKVAEEAGELLRHAIAARYGYDGTEAEWREQLADEVGDVLIATLTYAAAEGLDAAACVAAALAKLEARDGRYRQGWWRKEEPADA